MKITYTLLFLFFYGSLTAQQNNILPKEVQIKTANLAAPEGDRNQTKVYGYNEDGKMVVLREGSNNLVCLADNPEKNGIAVSCYNKKLDDFMARGRELKAQGMSTEKLRKTRGQEAKESKLKLPDAPSMTYIVSGLEEDYNPETGELKNLYMRYVIYMPYATTTATGLPDKPYKEGMPWLMDPGTHRAHIMITPPRD